MHIKCYSFTIGIAFSAFFRQILTPLFEHVHKRNLSKFIQFWEYICLTDSSTLYNTVTTCNHSYLLQHNKHNCHLNKVPTTDERTMLVL
jgi:hypothetical protein